MVELSFFTYVSPKFALLKNIAQHLNNLLDSRTRKIYRIRVLRPQEGANIIDDYNVFPYCCRHYDST